MRTAARPAQAPPLRMTIVPAAASDRPSTLPILCKNIAGGFSAALPWPWWSAASSSPRGNKPPTAPPAPRGKLLPSKTTTTQKLRAAREVRSNESRSSENQPVENRPREARPQPSAALRSPSSMLLEGLKEELFELEVEHKQGRISQQEYDKAKAALDHTLQRALKREAAKQT